MKLPEKYHKASKAFAVPDNYFEKNREKLLRIPAEVSDIHERAVPKRIYQYNWFRVMAAACLLFFIIRLLPEVQKNEKFNLEDIGNNEIFEYISDSYVYSENREYLYDKVESELSVSGSGVLNDIPDDIIEDELLNDHFTEEL